MRYLILIAFIMSGCAAQRAVIKESSLHKTVYFGFNQTKTQQEDVLDDVVKTLKREKKAFAILEGHADPIGSDSYNEILAEKRAREVRVYLAQHGIDPSQSVVLSKGEREPLVRTNDRLENQKNRRVEILITLTRNKGNL